MLEKICMLAKTNQGIYSFLAKIFYGLFSGKQ